MEHAESTAKNVNQLFYNITSGSVHKVMKIQHEKRSTISEVIVRGKRNIKQNRSFISIFLLKARGLYLTILKRRNLRLPLKVETDQFVICFVLPECLSVKMCCILPPDSEANRDGADAEFPFPLFFSFLPHLLTLAHEKRSENCVCFGTSGPSLCIHHCREMAARAKRKNILAKRFAHACTVEIWSTLTYTEFDSVALLAM